MIPIDDNKNSRHDIDSLIVMDFFICVLVWMACSDQMMMYSNRNSAR